MSLSGSRVAVAMLFATWVGAASAAPCAGFTDVDDTSPFCGNVTFLRNRGVTLGCNTAGTLYCPGDPVSRLAMAAFMNRLADALFPLSCAPGQVMKWNGVVWTCSNDLLGAGLASARPPFVERNIDATGTGEFLSIVTGADGLPFVAYYEQSTGHLKVAHCETVDCATTTITTLDAAGDVGRHVSAVVQTNGLVAIAYYDVTNTALKIAFCSDVPCSSATFATVDNNNDVGKFASMTTTRAGGLQISYFDETLDDLKLASCNTVPCSAAIAWAIRTVAATGSVGRGIAITTAFDDALLIAYYDATLNVVRIAKCQASLCDTPTTATVHTLAAGRLAEGLAITLNQSGAPILTFIDRAAGGSGTLRIVVCDTADCAAPVVRSGGGTNVEVNSTAVTVPHDNRPVVMGAASVDSQDCEATGGSGGASGTLRKCTDELCTATAALNPTFAGGAAVAINSTGFPIFAWRRCGTTGSRLAILHCSTATCLGHIRPR